MTEYSQRVSCSKFGMSFITIHSSITIFFFYLEPDQRNCSSYAIIHSSIQALKGWPIYSISLIWSFYSFCLSKPKFRDLNFYFKASLYQSTNDTDESTESVAHLMTPTIYNLLPTLLILLAVLKYLSIYKLKWLYTLKQTGSWHKIDKVIWRYIE